MAEISLLIIGFVLGVLVGQSGGGSGSGKNSLQGSPAYRRRTHRAAA
jgi:hypothetical protein